MAVSDAADKRGWPRIYRHKTQTGRERWSQATRRCILAFQGGGGHGWSLWVASRISARQIRLPSIDPANLRIPLQRHLPEWLRPGAHGSVPAQRLHLRLRQCYGVLLLHAGRSSARWLVPPISRFRIDSGRCGPHRARSSYRCHTCSTSNLTSQSARYW